VSSAGPADQFYWVDTQIGTGGVTVSHRTRDEIGRPIPDGQGWYISDSAPIFSRFRGQPPENLFSWAKTIKVVYLHERKEANGTTRHVVMG
jgi:hypothetical protein